MKFLKLFIIILAGLTFVYAQSPADEYYNLIDNQYRLYDGKSSVAFLIEEFQEYIILYPNSVQEDEALFNLAHLYQIDKNKPAQLFTLIKLRILHPASPLIKNTYQMIDSMVIYDISLLLTTENERILKELNNVAPAANYRLAYIEFFSFLHSAEIKVFEKLLIKEIRQYKLIYGKNADNMDAINYWHASAYKRNGDVNLALINFQKVTNIYRSSKFVAPSLLEIARIYKSIGKQDRATDYLIELINQFPEAPETGDAQYELAQIYHYHFKDLNEALTNYKMLAQAFPDNKYFNSALNNAAKISEGMGNYTDALNSYMMIVENNKITEETLVALNNILLIYLDILKDYKQAAHIYLLMAQMFPDEKNAAQNLLNAAKLFKEKVNDPQKAKEVIQIIMTRYKDTNEAVEAEKIINRN